MTCCACCTGWHTSGLGLRSSPAACSCSTDDQLSACLSCVAAGAACHCDHQTPGSSSLHRLRSRLNCPLAGDMQERAAHCFSKTTRQMKLLVQHTKQAKVQAAWRLTLLEGRLRRKLRSLTLMGSRSSVCATCSMTLHASLAVLSTRLQAASLLPTAAAATPPAVRKDPQRAQRMQQAKLDCKEQVQQAAARTAR